MKLAKRAYIRLSPNAEVISDLSRPRVDRVGKKELLSAIVKFASLFPGSDAGMMKLQMNLHRPWAEASLGDLFLEYLENRSNGFHDVAKKMENRIEELIKYTRSGPQAVRLFEAVKAIKATNAFDPDRIARNLPLVVAFDGGVYKDYDGKEPFELVYVRDERFEALTGIYGNENLPSSIIGKGGIRYYPFSPEKAEGVRARMLREATRLAETMDRKNPFWDVLFDGGKTIIFQTREADKDAIISSWVKAVTRAGVLGKRYVAGPDMEMGEHEMELVERVYAATLKVIGRTGLYPTTGSSITKGGFPHKEWMVTGTGVAESLFVYLSLLSPEKRVAVRNVLIQGFGDVGGSLVRIIAKEQPNMRITGVSDVNAAIYDPKGLDLKVLVKMAEEGKSIKDYEKEGGKFSEEGRFLDNIDDLPFMQADVFLPAAKAEVINKENIGKLKVKAIIEGANNSVGRGLEEKLHEMGIMFIPGAAANGGGIYTSTEEMLHRYFDGVEKIIGNKAEYERHIVDSVRELAFASIRALLRESEKNGISPSEQLEMWTVKLREEVYRLTEIIARMDAAQITTGEYGGDTKDALFEIYRRRGMGHGKIPSDFGTKFAILATVREMLSWKELYKIEDVLAWMRSEDESDRREAAYILGRLKNKRPEVLEALFIALGDSSGRVRKNAVESVGQLMVAQMVEPGLLEAIAKGLDDQSLHAKNEAAAAIKQLRKAQKFEPKLLDALTKALVDRSNDARQNAMDAIEKLKVASALYERLEKMSEADPDDMVRQNALWVLSGQGGF